MSLETYRRNSIWLRKRQWEQEEYSRERQKHALDQNPRLSLGSAANEAGATESLFFQCIFKRNQSSNH